jgi:heat shock protein HslJ
VSADFVAAVNAENVPVVPSPPVPTPAPTRVPAATAVPPTATAIPPTPQAQINFWADRTQINLGECAVLNWDVRNVQGVWVYPQGANFSSYPRTGQGNERVCPSATTTYEMRVQLNDNTTQLRQVTITVIQAIAPPQPPVETPGANALAGTRWTVVNVNNGMGAVTGLIPGTAITMDFDVSGRVQGTAGCNTYFANYRIGGNTLSVDWPGTTNRLCDTPEGVMQQEQQFLSALQSAATFQITGNQLNIRAAADALAVVATRAP